MLLAPAWAGLSLSTARLTGVGWQLEGLQLQLSSDAPGRYRLAARIDHLTLPIGQWRGLVVRCADLQLDGTGYQCPSLTVTAEDAQGPQQLQGRLSYLDADHWSLQLSGIRLAGGRWQLQASGRDGWDVQLTGQGIALAKLLALIPQAKLPPWDWQGGLAMRLALRGQGSTPARVSLRADLTQGRWASPDGLQAGQDLAGRLTLDATHQGGAWRGQLSSAWNGGQVYTDPMFAELGKHPLHLASALVWQVDRGQLSLDKLDLRLGKLLSASGGVRLSLDNPAAADASLALTLPDLGGAYPVLLQPLLYGGALDALQMAGRATLMLTLAGGVPTEASVVLDTVHLDDQRGRFGVSNLDGKLHWRTGSTPPDSRLSWRSGHLYRMDFGAATTRLRLQDKGVTLLDPLVLPMLDGTLRIPSLVARDLGGTATTWRTSLQAQALSLPRLSQALGWPILSGDLSVQIPEVHYADGLLALDGELTAKAFDGTVRVTGLQLRDPLSPAPALRAEASLHGLDLERVTRVFDFGRITGRLEGRIDGLQLVGWQPVAFNALLKSPADDDLPHRISQRAVENLTALGNNGAVALSGTFLRVFESFRYDRLMLKVDLAGQRAVLDGIPHKDGGYYLVKGAGLPRIDVIGRNRNVAWRDLVERLRHISLKGAQVR